MELCAFIFKGVVHACRLVRMNVTEGISPDTWQEILPEHEKDLMSGASALKVKHFYRTYMNPTGSFVNPKLQV